ncbi:transferrin-binding protein-like solute binding protein [Pasteurellaceae bacterium 20609_3]|uniref:Slam-dependent surface lipoprotein n=1 Tax=Spirabiliibacterium mucosae TaxID=28156 RepID=UPI001AADDA39|nr:Slam-dependent surface lipoprotein [Spirabiliibacterium mucosae]MBE2899021.1 transferrin-binding protein-like solute binding protein [Spirabiliibacterium mucosae]
MQGRMIKLTQLTLTALCASVLIACGSGGGDGGDNNPNDKSVPYIGQNAKGLVGTVMTIDPEKEDRTQAVQLGNVQAKGLNKIMLDGVAIDIMPSHQHRWTVSNQANGAFKAVCCGQYQFSRLGAVDEGVDKKLFLFYYGMATEKMPTSGEAKYSGHSLYLSDNAKEDSYEGDFNMTVDFATRDITGTIHNRATDITLKGKALGNVFGGTARSSLDKSETRFDAKFYGDNAAEVAGMTNGKSSWGVGFIGKR